MMMQRFVISLQTRIVTAINRKKDEVINNLAVFINKLNSFVFKKLLETP